MNIMEAILIGLLVEILTKVSEKWNVSQTYLAIGLAIVLVIWGVDVTGIVASLGILTLIIGLGCQSLIQDVVSGLFIVFDDYFSVGDMVIIDGFRGYVSEIGLRSVKIDDRVGDIKTITNSNIGTCVNLSREDNMITVNICHHRDPHNAPPVFSGRR